MVLQWKATANRMPKIDKKYDVAISYRHFDVDVFFVMNNMYAKRKIFWIHGVQQLTAFEKKVLLPVYKKYDTIVPVSHSARSNFLNFFPLLETKCKIIHCIVDANEIKEYAKIGESFSTNKFHILTIGRLSEEKGINLAISACELLVKEGYQFEWLVLGDGNQREELKKMIKIKNLEDYFILKGYVNNPYNYLKNCDIYVQPSYLESYCLTINEAKIFNRPIVCTNIPAFKEQLSNNKTGIICELNPRSLAKGIKMLLNNEDLKNKLSTELSIHDYSSMEAISFFYENILK